MIICTLDGAVDTTKVWLHFSYDTSWYYNKTVSEIETDFSVT
jgi:hypothetical protein